MNSEGWLLMWKTCEPERRAGLLQYLDRTDKKAIQMLMADLKIINYEPMLKALLKPI